MPLTGAAKREYQREWSRNKRMSNPTQSVEPNLSNPLSNPDTEGVDGWHTDGRRYVFQDTGMGGLVRNYRGGPALFLYSRSWC